MTEQTTGLRYNKAMKNTVIGKLVIKRLHWDGFEVDKDRTIRIWLPPYYNPQPKRNYSVIYAFDGQNLFDEKTSFVGEWQLDETITARKGNTIVVGIDNSKDRLSEYLPDFSSHAIDCLKYKGKTTLDFLVQKVIPYIEKNYPVSKRKSGRSILGSSMGGLMALSAELETNAMFSTCYCFSPSFTIFRYGLKETKPAVGALNSNKARNDVTRTLCTEKFVNRFKLILCAGTKEDYEVECMVNNRFIKTKLKQAGWDERHLVNLEYQGYAHNEMQWRKAFRDSYKSRTIKSYKS